MSADPPIRSSSNQKLRHLARVIAGKEPGLMVLEGERLIADAVRAALPLEALYLAPEHAASLARTGWRARETVWVEPGLLRRVSSLEHSAGWIALVPMLERRALGELAPRADSLLVIAHGVSDPGNLGAIARSAEALGASGFCPIGGASPCGAKALRGSMGSLLRLPLYGAGSAEEAARALAQQGVKQVRGATRGGEHPLRHDWSGPHALWITGERGDAPPGLELCAPLTIPMRSEVESLNVAVALALLLYSAQAARAGAAR